MLCDALDVSRSGYYKWKQQSGVSKRTKKRVDLLSRILKIFEESRQTYGCPRMYQQLRREGYRCNYKTVEKLMREHEIQPCRRRKYRSTTDSKHKLPIADNVLRREFRPKRPNEVWVSDITYVETKEGWLYLSVFIDLFSKMVVGWSMSERMTAELVTSAFTMATARRGVHAPRIVHSDRGSQYASEVFRNQIKGCVQSMSRKANCWDNAPAESFFGSLKSEHIYRHNFETREKAEMSIFEYIEIFYNKKRLHSSLGYLSPEEFEEKGKKVA
jgi:transposase InsO family protein